MGLDQPTKAFRLVLGAGDEDRNSRKVNQS